MDAEDKAKLDRLLKLAEENNAYIRRVRSTQKTSQMFKAIYWVIIIVFVLGGFYYIKPYLNTITNLYSTVSGQSASKSSIFALPDTQQLQELVKELKSK